LDAIKRFWFPRDSSVTLIHKFNNDIVHLSIEGDLAFGTHKTFLSWSYKKGSVDIAKDQWGIAMTVYRKKNGQWKIWRQLWTDVKVEDRSRSSARNSRCCVAFDDLRSCPHAGETGQELRQHH
jgi:hypothetical protein